MAPPKDAKMCFQMEIDDIECIFPGLLSIYFGVVIWYLYREIHKDIHGKINMEHK